MTVQFRTAVARLRCAVLLLALASPAAAQEARGSRYIPVGEWPYEAITALKQRGFLRTLSPLAQPYRRAEVAKALADVSPVSLDAATAHWLKLLREELAPEFARLAQTDSIALGMDLAAGATASTSRRLDPMLPYREAADGKLANRFWLNNTIGFWAERGRLAAQYRLHGDVWEDAAPDGDPDGIDPGGITFLTLLKRSDNAYMTFAFNGGEVFLGRTRRNWAPLGTTGLALSDNALPFPHFGFEWGGSRLRLRALAGELDEMGGERRYMAAQQLSYVLPDFAISIGEAKVFTSQSGVQLRNLNPFEVYFFDHDTQPTEHRSNLVLNGTGWLRLGAFTLRGEALLDDIDVQPGSGGAEPLIYALNASARYLANARWLELGADFRQVSGWAYRTQGVIDEWSFQGRGLGDNHSDYDRLTLLANVQPPVAGLRLTPKLQLQRKGEGDFRDPIPEDAVYRSDPTIFLGDVEKTVRVALAGRYQPIRFAWAEWDAGVSRISTVDHEPGRNATEFTGVARLGVSWEIPRFRAIR